MNKLFLGINLCVFLALSGCTVIRNEAGYPGGNAGKLSDKSFYVARNHEQRVDRFLIALALVAPLAEATSQSGEDAASTARYINGLYSSLMELRATLGSANCNFDDRFGEFAIGPPSAGEAQKILVGDTNCTLRNTTDSAFTFESLSFDAQRSLFRLVRQSADNLNIRANLTSLSGLNPIDLLGKVWGLRALIPMMMEYLATYRDLSVIFADSLAVHCTGLLPQDRPAGCKRLVNSFANNLHDSVIILDDSNNPYLPIKRALKDALALADDPKMSGWELKPSHIAALLVHLDRSCEELFREQQADLADGDLVSCGKPIDGKPADFSNSPRGKFAILSGVSDG